jgi:hypothetical protein
MLIQRRQHYGGRNKYLPYFTLAYYGSADVGKINNQQILVELGRRSRPRRAAGRIKNLRNHTKLENLIFTLFHY